MTNSDDLKKLKTPTDTYFLQEKLGEGVQGEVYKAVSSKNQYFAIKITSMSKF